MGIFFCDLLLSLSVFLRVVMLVQAAVAQWSEHILVL